MKDKQPVSFVRFRCLLYRHSVLSTQYSCFKNPACSHAKLLCWVTSVLVKDKMPQCVSIVLTMSPHLLYKWCSVACLMSVKWTICCTYDVLCLLSVTQTDQSIAAIYSRINSAMTHPSHFFNCRSFLVHLMYKQHRSTTLILCIYFQLLLLYQQHQWRIDY